MVERSPKIPRKQGKSHQILVSTIYNYCWNSTLDRIITQSNFLKSVLWQELNTELRFVNVSNRGLHSRTEFRYQNCCVTKCTTMSTKCITLNYTYLCQHLGLANMLSGQNLLNRNCRLPLQSTATYKIYTTTVEMCTNLFSLHSFVFTAFRCVLKNCRI